jgi:hypothetical protein
MMIISIHTLKASYGDSDYACQMSICSYQLSESNVNYTIHYQLHGTVTNVLANTERQSLIINATSSRSDTEFQVLLPKALIQATTDSAGKESSEEIEFTVLLDDNETPFEEGPVYWSENDDDKYRFLSIPFSSQHKQIAIIGTWVAPEFNYLPAIVMAMSVAAVILVTRMNTKRIRFR